MPVHIVFAPYKHIVCVDDDRPARQATGFDTDTQRLLKGAKHNALRLCIAYSCSCSFYSSN